MQHPALRAATRIFSWLVPKEFREPLIGDLTQEYSRRAQTVDSSAALKWYLKEICASIPPLLWTRITRSAWISTLGVAVVAYVAVFMTQMIIFRMIYTSFGFVPRPIDLTVSFLIVACMGYAAERLRRRAAIVLGAIALLVATTMVVLTPQTSPLWFRIALPLVGPVAAFVGGLLPSLTSRRS